MCAEVAIALIMAKTPFIRRPISLFRHIDQFSELNPLLKAPTLLTDDGVALMDSSVILDYLAGVDPRHPWASPIYGDLAGLPPALIQVGSDEILHDDAARLAKRLDMAGGSARLEIWPRMPHVWHIFAPMLPEARRAIGHIGSFLRELL